MPIHTQNQAGSTPASDDGPSVPLDVNKAQLATGSSRDKQVRQKCWMITDKAARTSDGTVYLSTYIPICQFVRASSGLERLVVPTAGRVVGRRAGKCRGLGLDTASC